MTIAAGPVNLRHIPGPGCWCRPRPVNEHEHGWAWQHRNVILCADVQRRAFQSINLGPPA